MTVWLPSILRFVNRNKKNAAQGSVDTVVSTVLPVPDEHLKLLKLRDTTEGGACLGATRSVNLLAPPKSSTRCARLRVGRLLPVGA